MANVVSEMEDALIKHQVFILRVEGGQTRDMILTIDNSIPELTGVLVLWLESATFGQQVTLIQEKQFQQLERKLGKIRGVSIKEAQKDYIASSAELIEHEIEFTEALFIAAIPVKLKYGVPDADKVSRRLLNFGSYKGSTIRTWFDNLRLNDIKRIMSTVRFGVTGRLSVSEIIRSVIGTRAFNFTDGAINTTRNDAKRLVRTVTNGLVNDARGAFAVDNADIIKGERYTAILDGRTTVICIGLAGTIVEVGMPPRPPQHGHCRSFMVPLPSWQLISDIVGDVAKVRNFETNKFRDINFRTEAKMKAGVKKWNTLSRDTQDAFTDVFKHNWMRENIPDIRFNKSYEEFLKKQPRAFQDNVLGKWKAGQWRSGKLSLGDFVDNSGHILTIPELRKLEG